MPSDHKQNSGLSQEKCGGAGSDEAAAYLLKSYFYVIINKKLNTKSIF